MFRNYLKVAFRNLFRNKSYSFINITGLAISVCCCILILLFIQSEYRFDRFHTKADNIYRIWQYEKYEGEELIGPMTPISAATVIQSSFPEVQNICRVHASSPAITVNDRIFSDEMRMVDSTFFKVFDFKLIAGSKENPFPSSNAVVLTPITAKKYFGDENPIGKIINIQLGDNQVPFSVSGIAAPAPQTSSIQYALLIPFSNDKLLFRPGALKNWFNVSIESYLLLKDGESPEKLEAKFPSMIKNYLGEDYKEGNFAFHLQPITDIHLNTKLSAGNEPISDPKYAYILGTIGILLLFVACINFIILTIGRSGTRALEVGVRKVMGANRSLLVKQFWGEAFLLTAIAFMLGLAGAYLLLDAFNQVVLKKLEIRPEPSFILFCLGLITVIAMIAGIYPALVLSSFKPVEVLKGKLQIKGAGWLRKSLIVGQFFASITLIICTIAITRQMDYLRSKDLGFSKEHVIVVPTGKSGKEADDISSRYRTALLTHPEVKDVSVSTYSFAQTPWVDVGFTDIKGVYHNLQYNQIDANFIRTMGLEMKEGRMFSQDNSADYNNSAIVNEAFIEEFKITDPIGKKLPGHFDQQIIGVVKDFHFMSLHSEIKPLLLSMNADTVLRKAENIYFTINPQPRLSVRFSSGNPVAQVELLKNVWKEVQPGRDFDFSFLNDAVAAQYQAEQRTGTLVKSASVLSILIACMGLFGLVTLTVAKRTREIGIRKVLGSGVFEIVKLITKEFIILIGIATLLAFPVAAWLISDWLKDFAYHTIVGWQVYVIAAVVTMLIAILTIAWQTVKAALMNPVKSLKTE